ncbi:MAG: hypothetical protein J6N50_07820 [Bacteroidales bacterium]|nr:hypothetical protein [Bacteroidales bacterium]
MNGTIKHIHVERDDAYKAATIDFYREGGTVTVETREDWKDALVASDGMTYSRHMAVCDLRDFGPLPEKLGCYHAYTKGGMEYIEFFLEKEEVSAFERYISFGKWE